MPPDEAQPGGGDPDLVVTLERPLPGPLPVGTGTAVFVLGTCFHRRETVAGLDLLVNGQRHAPDVAGAARPDAGAVAGPAAALSGFWGTVPVPAREVPGEIELEIAVRLADGREERAPLGRIAVEPHPIAPPSPLPAHTGTAPLIAVCMATYEPDPELFARQVASLRDQTDTGWICLISDDHSAPDHQARIRAELGDDPRFVLSPAPERLGFYRNFERALGLVPAEAALVALCDQDDVWHPGKLATLRDALGDARLVYSDQRLTRPDGRVLRDTFWHGRRNEHRDLASMLVANTITGASALFRRDLLDVLLPFPDPPGFQFHDHWLGVAALATGDVAYVARPLYDYVQHAGAVFGDVSSSPAPERTWRARLRGRAGEGAPGAGRAAALRAQYFYGYLAREVLAATLLVRGGADLPPAKRRTLERFRAAARSPRAFAWLAARAARPWLGRDETLGTEAELVRGLAWRALVAATSRRGPRRARLALDGTFPPPQAFSQRRLRRWRARL